METNIFIEDVFFSILDIETTGLTPYFGDKICEIGILKVKNGTVLDSFHSLINPKRQISPGTSAINGITNEMVKNAPSLGDVIKNVRLFIQDSCLVCHNAAFDLSFISMQINQLILPPFKNPVIDTLILARKYFRFPSNSLGNIARTLNIEIEEEHRALGDVKTTNKILDYFIKDLRKRKNIKTLNELLEIQGGSVKVPEPESIVLPPIIEESLKSKKIINLKYISGKGVKTERDVEVIEVAKFKDYIYLIAFCNLRREQRTFRLDRIIRMDLN